MFEGLSKGLQQAFKSISGKGKLTEARICAMACSWSKQSMLEADVSLSGRPGFHGEQVTDAGPGRARDAGRSIQVEQLIGIVLRQSWSNVIMGPVDASACTIQAAMCTVLMMCGLQGSGKTTTCGKLAKLMVN